MIITSEAWLYRLMLHVMSYLIVEQTALKGHGVMITATTTFPSAVAVQTLA